MFVSSHLMSEMALTAQHLIVIGRGKLIADDSIDHIIAGAGSSVLVRSPRPTSCQDSSSSTGATVRCDDGALSVIGPTLAHRRSRRESQHHPARAQPTARVARGRVLRAHRRQRRVSGHRRQTTLRRSRRRRDDVPTTATTDDASTKRSSAPSRRASRISRSPPGDHPSEWTKLRSVRSTVWALFATFGITVGFGVLLSWAYINRYDRLSLRERFTFDPTGTACAGCSSPNSRSACSVCR